MGNLNLVDPHYLLSSLMYAFSLFGCCILNMFISKLCFMKLYSEQSPGGTTSNAFLGGSWMGIYSNADETQQAPGTCH